MRQLGPEVLFVELTDRKKQILKVVVEDYVRTAEPVGSKAIAAEMGGVSPTPPPGGCPLPRVTGCMSTS